MRTAELARNRWVGILQHFGVSEQHLRNKHTSCPFCGGKDRYRFDNKDGNGTWICSQCGSGNGFDLLTRITGEDFKAIAMQVDKIAGKVVEMKQKPKRDPSIYLKKIHAESTADIAGTPVDRYLKSRGLDAHKALRFHPALKYYDGSTIVGIYPAMLARFDDSGGNAITYHVTYLTQAGEKAPLPCNRKFMAGKAKLNGGAIRLGNVDKSLFIAEGIETALSVQKMLGVACWAVGNAGLMDSFEVPDGVTNVGICADNDKNYTGQKAAYSLANRLSMAGINATVHIPGVAGTDFNDELMGSK